MNDELKELHKKMANEFEEMRTSNEISDSYDDIFIKPHIDMAISHILSKLHSNNKPFQIDHLTNALNELYKARAMDKC